MSLVCNRCIGNPWVECEKPPIFQIIKGIYKGFGLCKDCSLIPPVFPDDYLERI